MCGIVGVVGKIPDISQVVRSRDALSHRGPDDSGIYFQPDEGVALGHRRLSIIDLSSDAHQPFVSHDERYVLTFNGEIYNYLELKEELTGFYPFQTKSDTEVLIASYAKWGEECVNHFNGMFAFALWDKKEKKLFCARDHVGIKPFFYFQNSEFFAFASEIKGLFPLIGKLNANEEVIFDYLQYGLYDHRPETFFSGVFSLPAGHILSWSHGEILITKYWDLKKIVPSILSADEIYQEFDALLTDAVRLQFRSDVPVGINLSSGLDSNSLLYFGRNLVGDDIHTFSICLSDEEYNECDLIHRYAQLSKKELWHQSWFDPSSLFESAKEMVRIQDQPYGGIPTIIYSAAIAEAKKQGVTVLLEGQGVDELLAGYNYYLLEYERDLGQINGGSLSLSQDGTKLFEKSILHAKFLDTFKDRKQLSFFAPFDSHLLNAQYRDLFFTKLPRVLRFNDHVSMKYGRELRVPFLDRRIVEFCFSLSSEYKIHDGRQKVLIRELMKGKVSSELVSRQKKSFGAVQNVWLKKYFEKHIWDILNSESFQSRNFWDHSALVDKTKNFFSGNESNSFFLWQCINLELWMREFID